MKTFLILLAIGFGNSEKLDLKYLPPPGSELAGGSPGAIDIPFRLPIAYSTTVPPVLTEMTSLMSLINSESQIGSKVDKKVKTPLQLMDPSMSEGDNTKFQSNNSHPEMLTGNSYPNTFFNSKSVDIHPDELFIPHSNTEDVLFSGIFEQNYVTKPAQNQENNDVLHPGLDRGKNHSNKNIKLLIHKTKYDNNGFIQDYLINDTFTLMKKLFANRTSNLFEKNSNPGRRAFPTLIFPSDPSQTNSTINVSKNFTRRPQANLDRNALILNYKNIIKPDGFTYTFDTSNGIHVNENGTATNGVSVQGSYSYTGDDGKFYTVTYTADENGFQPRGEHLPTSPPVPEAILKVIEQAAKDKEAGIFDDGSYNENKYGYKSYQNILNADKKPHNEGPVFVNGADIPYKEFETNIVENNNIFLDKNVEMQNKLDRHSQENEVNFNLNISKINFEGLENKTKIGVSEKKIIEDKVIFSEESFEHKFSPNAKMLSPSQIMIDFVTNKDLSNKNISPVKNETNSGEGMINKISLPRNKNVIKVTTPSETSAITNNGYLYIKPQRKFDELENRFLESVDFISEREKNIKTSKTKDKKPQPFITPNVSRDYEDSQEDNTEETEASVRNFALSYKSIPKLDQKLSRDYDENYPPTHSNSETKENNEIDISIHNVTEQFAGTKNLDIRYLFYEKSSQNSKYADKNQNVNSIRSGISKNYYQPNIILSTTEPLTGFDSTTESWTVLE